MLSQYQFLDNINSGAFGTVKKVRCIDTGKLCAMKVLPRVMGGSPRDIHTAREIAMTTLANSKTDRVVRLYDAFQDAENTYMVMELCEGHNLSDLIKAPMSLRVCRIVGKNVLMALAGMHSCGVLHGDVKPHNIVFRGFKAKLCDLGHAQDKILHCTGGFKRQGTPWYAAPEVHVGEYGLSADVWAVGIVLYSMAYGRHPFVKPDFQYPLKLYDVIMQTEADFPVIDDPLFEPFKELVSFCLEKEGCNRISSARALKHRFFGLKKTLKEN